MNGNPLLKYLHKSVAGFVGRPQQGNLLSLQRIFMLSQKALEDFKKIWQEEFGEKVSDESATEEAVNLLTLFDAIYRPIRKSNISCSKRSSASPL